MPSNNPTSVTLDVRNSAASGEGWINATGSNGQPYSYRYSGGNQPANNGNVSYGVGGGNAAITLTLAADARYQIQGINFVNDPQGQLSTHGNANTMRVINDSCSGALEAQYKVTVLDTTANATVPCDPMVFNVPTR